MSIKPHYQEINTVELLIKYYEDGLIEWCNPQTGKPYFSRIHPTGKSPIVKFTPPANQSQGPPICSSCNKPMAPQHDPIAKEVTGYLWHCESCMPEGTNISVGRNKVEKVYVTEAELFEAVIKYLQVKGFSTEVLSVREINEAEEEK